MTHDKNRHPFRSRDMARAMTPSMKLSEIKRKYRAHADSEQICDDLEEAMHLGHVFGLARAVDEAAADNPFASVVKRLAALRAERVQHVRTISEEI